MSDITIPGVNNRYFSQEQIQDLVELEAAPIRRLERQIEEHEQVKRSWQDMSRNISALQGAARNLYGIDSPFRSRIAQSSNESILTATASRHAEEERTDVVVKQTAATDRFASDPLPGDYSVPEGTYTFTVGDREHSLRFRGGNLDNFVTSINRRMGDAVRARVVQDTPSTRRLVIESRQEGAENALGFDGDARQLALDLGIIEERLAVDRAIPLPDGRDELAVGAEDSRQIRVSPTAEENLRVSLEVRVTSRPEDSREVPETPSGPRLPDSDSVTLRDVTVRDSGLAVDLPDMEPPEPPPVVEDPDILFLRAGEREVRIPAPPETGEYETIDISLRDYLESGLDAIEIRNRNTLKDVSVRNVRVYDPETRGDFAPRNALSTARDSIVNVDGIDFTRGSNRIEDIIPGTTLNIRRASTEPVEVAVGPDRESVKDAIIEFVGYYNQLFTEALILSRGDEAIVDEIGYFTDEEREAAFERLGRLRGDSTVNRIVRSLQSATSQPFQTEREQHISLLAQIGISTSSAQDGGGGIDPSRMRGYLQINENTLDEALANDFTAVRQLFGWDTDGDGAINSGAAFEVDRLMRPYVQTGGIIATRTSTIDSSISRADRQIETYSERLENYEQRLRRDFARMEGAIQQMESNAERFQNMNPGQQR
ncbi:flagellar filament capping protein FliD [Spirochaeta africana]|uniref:Flagellar hook-associated protein 2 n=1 Tax=Spirochaeta africana (strain ATCC 700263 / DSM 8902 / Z-7692) TaxID=889378 RepID=H9UHA4_SPIAZ|nr:flagellar filament capping protein FliD [Spirochaeta africana]AFG36897.1 flagellar capping protein [Spirochaeta africana DSM 8902]